MNVNGGLKTVAKKDTGIQAQSFNALLNSFLDQEGYRRRFNEVLGKRAPQFVSSVVSLVNADGALKQAFYNAPVTVIQSCLKAATYDLPIDPGLGYAYVVPFKNHKKNDIMEAVFILGYKGMIQLALRSGCYKRLNVTDVREGELKRYDRLTEEIEIEFIEDEDERDQKPIIGYCGYFQLVNGMEKTIYMSVKAIAAHEEKFRRGKYQSKGWRDDKDGMSRKTILRKLIGKWGLMSINYQTASIADIATAQAIASGNFDADDETLTIDQEPAAKPEEEPKEEKKSEKKKAAEKEPEEEIPFPGEDTLPGVDPETGEVLN